MNLNKLAITIPNYVIHPSPKQKSNLDISKIKTNLSYGDLQILNKILTKSVNYRQIYMR